jgi:hypothetical protein
MNMSRFVIARISDDNDTEALPPTHGNLYPILNTVSIGRPEDGGISGGLLLVQQSIPKDRGFLGMNSVRWQYFAKDRVILAGC